MTGEYSAEKACGQVLICLKMSNLNYMVKETPFSAFVTIRKKFLKTPIDTTENVEKKETYTKKTHKIYMSTIPPTPLIANY